MSTHTTNFLTGNITQLKVSTTHIIWFFDIELMINHTWISKKYIQLQTYLHYVFDASVKARETLIKDHSLG